MNTGTNVHFLVYNKGKSKGLTQFIYLKNKRKVGVNQGSVVELLKIVLWYWLCILFFNTILVTSKNLTNFQDLFF